MAIPNYRNVTELTSSGVSDKDESHDSIDCHYLDISNSELSRDAQVKAILCT